MQITSYCNYHSLSLSFSHYVIESYILIMESLDLRGIASCFVVTEKYYISIFLERKCNKQLLRMNPKMF